jgi:hypothetical protein
LLIENHTEPINTVTGENSVLQIVKVDGTYSYHWALKGSDKICGCNEGRIILNWIMGKVVLPL